MSKSGLGKSNDSCVKGLHPFPHLFAKLSVFLGCIFFKKKNTRNSFTKQCTNESECCEEVIYCANIQKKRQRIKRLTSSIKGQLMTLTDISYLNEWHSIRFRGSTLMLFYHCHKPVFTPKMAIFRRAGIRERGLPLPLAFQYLILLIWRPYDLNLVMIS